VPATPLKILVIENEPDRLIYIYNLLKAHGFEPLTAVDPVEALSKARSQRPSLIVLDAMLPADQIQLVYGKLKSDPSLRQVPTVMLSSLTRLKHGHFQGHPFAPSIGRWPAPEAFLPNPPEAEDFIAVVRRLTSMRKDTHNTEEV
jgi:CheY-like chemotaxis protein